MNRNACVCLCVAVAALAYQSFAHEPVTRARTEVNFPDIPGFVTLKGDFHVHTVFSDGLVWPSVRTDEAWREGLDAIAITDHIEYQPHKADLSTNHNRSFEIARDASKDLGVIVVKGSEITRKMPPGHLNAIFLTNSLPLAVTNWHDAVKAAHDQGAFIFWNHPGWERQITNGVVRWYPEHTQMLEEGLLQGIEVVNSREYYPEAHRWAMEKKLTMLSNSDIHNPLNLDYHVHSGDHRPLTLIFAKERSAAAIKQALLARRTAVYSGDKLIGDEQFLRPLFERSLEISKATLEIKAKGKALLHIRNNSDLDYELARLGEPDEVAIPKNIVLAARKTVLLTLEGKSAATKGTKRLSLPYAVANAFIGPNEPMPVELPVQVKFVPAEAKK